MCAKLLAFLFWIWYSILAFDGSLAQLGEHLPYKQRVTGSNPVASTKKDSADCLCGNSSVVERHLAKVNVAGSNLVSRSKISVLFFIFSNRCQSRQRWRHSQVVRHGSAKPLPPVQIWVAPPKNTLHPFRCGVFCLLLQLYTPLWWNRQTQGT